MALSQMYALTGQKRYREPYVADINARTPYLGALYAQKAENEYQDKMYGLDQRRLALSEDALREQEKANKRARTLGYANIGLGAGLGLAGLASEQGWFDKLKGGSAPIQGLVSLSSEGLPLSEMGKSLSTSDLVGGSDLLSPMGSGGAWDWLSSGLKNLGGFGVFDAGQGIYDSVVGNSINASDLFSDSAFNELTGII